MSFNQRLYNRWYDIIRRCKLETRNGFKDYGGRGIGVCKEWLEYDNFRLWAEQNGYADELEIDRLDNNGDYEPSNCRFVTRGVNALNRRNSIRVEGSSLAQIAESEGLNYDALLMKHERMRKGGEEITLKSLLRNKNVEKLELVEGLTLREVAEKFNMPYKKIKARYFNLKAANCDITLEILTTPEKVGLHRIENKTLKELAEEYGIKYNTLRCKACAIAKKGMPLTVDVLLNSTKVYSASQSITTPIPKG